jgi:surface antigen
VPVKRRKCRVAAASLLVGIVAVAISSYPAEALARSVLAGGLARFATTLTGNQESNCVLNGLRAGKKLTVSRFVARRRDIRFSWEVPSASREGRWRLRVSCSGHIEHIAGLYVRGRPRGPLSLVTSGSVQVRQAGARLVTGHEIEEGEEGTTKVCASPSSTGITPSAYNTTPPGELWQVPKDPCNTEGRSGNEYYENCAYWAAEKRPDIWVEAVWKYGYSQPPGGAWNIELDARRAGFPIDHVPAAGDVAAWPSDGAMGAVVPFPGAQENAWETWTASPGGHVAYVEAAEPGGIIVISQMGVAGAQAGETNTLRYDAAETFFIHRR